MNIHHFPGATDALDLSVCEASVDPAAWPAAIRSLETLFPGARCAIRAEPHAALLPARFMGRDGACRTIRERIWPDRRLAALHRAGDVLPLPHSAGGLGGTVLLLHRDRACHWLLTVRAGGHDEPRQDKTIAALLARKKSRIVSAFRVFHAANSGGIPLPGDVEAVWDRLPGGVVLLSASLQPLAGNMTAGEFLSVRSLFRHSGNPGRIRAADPDLQDAIENAAARITDGANKHTQIVIPRGYGPLALRFSALGRCAILSAATFAPQGREPRLMMRMGEPAHPFGSGGRRPERAAPAVETA